MPLYKPRGFVFPGSETYGGIAGFRHVTRSYAYILLLTLGAVWGASFLFIKVLVDEIAPTEVATGRMFFGVGAVLLVAAGSGRARFRISCALLPKVITLAVLNAAIPFTLIPLAEQRIDSGEASVLVSSLPLFTALFAALMFVEDRLTPGRVVGLAVGFAGVIVVAGSESLAIGSASTLGAIAMAGAAASYGAAAVYMRVLLRSEDPVNLTGLHLVVGMMLMLPLTFAVEGVPDYTLSTEGWLALIGLGAVGTGLAYLAFFWLVENIGSVRSSLVAYVIPVVGLLLGWAVLGEDLGVNVAIGVVLIFLGASTVMRRPVPHAGEDAGTREDTGVSG